MKSKLNATANKGYVELSMGMDPVPLTIEESRALRGELEKAEEEVGRKKSAFQEWDDEHGLNAECVDAWNAAIEAALVALDALPTMPIAARLLTLKELVE